MIILDTNVVSELMRAEPDKNVQAWMDAQNSQDLKTTAISVAELLYGVQRLPNGRRKTGLRDAIDSILADELAGKVLVFDDNAARQYATLVVAREMAGRPIDTTDAQIASICRNHNAALATRNGKDFDATGITVIDPWTAT